MEALKKEAAAGVLDEHSGAPSSRATLPRPQPHRVLYWVQQYCVSPLTALATRQCCALMLVAIGASQSTTTTWLIARIRAYSYGIAQQALLRCLIVVLFFARDGIQVEISPGADVKSQLKHCTNGKRTANQLCLDLDGRNIVPRHDARLSFD